MEGTSRDNVAANETAATPQSQASQGGWGTSPLPGSSTGVSSPQSGWPSGGALPQRSIAGFHRGYATTLKVVTYIFAFGLPLVTFLFLCMAARGRDAGAQILLSFLGCGVWAFVLWLFGSFAAKLFDLVSKIAMLNDQLLHELRKENRK